MDQALLAAPDALPRVQMGQLRRREPGQSGLCEAVALESFLNFQRRVELEVASLAA